MQKLIRNPIFRIVGVAVILYYGLFYNKSLPDSLGNRLAPDKIKDNLVEISSKSINIIANVKKADEIKKSLADKKLQDNKEGAEQQDGK